MAPSRSGFNARPWWQWAAALAGLLVLGLLAAYAGGSIILAVGLLAAAVVLIGALVLWPAPGLILIVLLVNVWLVAGRADPGDLLQHYTFVRWLSYLIIPAFGLLVLARVWLRGGRWRLTGLEPFLAGLVALTIVSGWVNHTGLTAIVLSLAIYLRYPLLFALLYQLDLKSAPYLRFVRAIIWVSLALTCEAVVDFALFHKSGDHTFFTTGVDFGHVNAGLLLVYALCLSFAHALVTRWRWYHLAFLGLVVVAAWIASVRSLLVLLPLLPAGMWLVQHRLAGRRRLPRLALAGVAGAVVLAVALGPTLINQSVLFGLPRFAQFRLVSVVDALRAMVPANREWLGFGPRSYSPGSLGPPGEMYQLELATRGTYWLNNLGQSGLASGLSELGVFGFGVYWLMLAAMLATVLRFRSSYLSTEPDPHLRQRWSLLTLAFVGVWLHYALFGLVYYDVWRLDITSLAFWGLAAAIYSQRAAWRRAQVQAPA